MIKAAFFDVDGTLLSYKTRKVCESAKAAIAKLQAQGILCIVATGRHMIQMSKLPVADIPFDAFVMLNGQLVLDKQQNMLFGVPIEGKAKAFLVEKFNDHTYPAVMVEQNQMYLNCVTDHVLDVNKRMAISLLPLSDYRGGDIYQICAYLRPEDEHLVEPISKDCVLTSWHFGGKDIIAGGGGKMAGIKRYLDMIGIKPEEIIAFGDAENDLDMLRFAGIGVAMGNAEEAAKAAADYVTADIDEDGIEKALKHFGLI
ncbi:MAG: Cof-type HAD-IIB family hydrolase [Oscillospiraceae bacterium]|nr:Cof-type HAD-IIB family hydrolase [Oscillospiraceae bacterium]